MDLFVLGSIQANSGVLSYNLSLQLELQEIMAMKAVASLQKLIFH